MKDLRLTKGILVRGSYSISKFTHSDLFCKNILERSRNMSLMFGESYDYDVTGTLVYDTSNNSRLEAETIQTIMDLLLQLRAAQSDQNIFVQNNTVVRQQILDQLKREISQVQNNLTQNQVQQLKIVSNNLFDEDTLNDLIKSLLKDAKKKLTYSWDEQSNSIVAKEPETPLLVETAVTSVKPVDVIKKYQTILSNTVNTIVRDRVFLKNNIVNKTEVYNKEQSKNELVVREVKKPIEITTEEFIKKENLIENVEKVYNEKLLKSIDLVPLVTKTFLKTLEFGGINKYKEVLSTVWDKVYLRKELSKTTLRGNRKVTDKVEDKEIVKNTLNTYFNKVITQDVTGLTLYKEIRSAYRNKKLNLKNIVINKKGKTFIDAEVVARHNNLVLSTNEKVYNNRLITEANLINKTIDKSTIEKENVVKQEKGYLYESQIEKLYKNSVFNKDVRNEKFLAKVNLENEFTNKIETIAKKTAEIATNNKLINRYENIVENIIEHVDNKIFERHTKKISTKTFKQKGTKTYKNKVKIASTWSTIREYENQYEQSIFNTDNVTKRLLNKNTLKVLRNRVNSLENLTENHVKTIQNESDLLSRHNLIVSNIVENIKSNRRVDETLLINKKAVKNKNLEERLKEATEVNLTEVQNIFEKLYKNSVFSVDAKTNKNIIENINENSAINKLINLDSKFLKNINKTTVKREADLINRLFVENLNISEEADLINKIINTRFEKNVLKNLKFKARNIENIEQSNIIEVKSYKDLINETTQNIIEKYQSEDIKRIVNRQNLINRKEVKNRGILEQLEEIQNLNETVVHKDLVNKLKTKSVDKILNSLEQNNVIEVKSYKDLINETTQNIIEKYQSEDIKRIVNRQNLINRKEVKNRGILEQLEEIQNLNETVVHKDLVNKINNKVYHRITDYSEKVHAKNLFEVNEKRIDEHLKQFKNSLIDNVTILNVLKDKAKIKEKYNSIIEKNYKENLLIESPLEILENISKTKMVNKIIPEKKIKLLPPSILQHKTLKVEENNIYRDVEEKEFHYYNQMIEDIGRKFVVMDNESLNIENVIDKVQRKDMIYKTPIKIQSEEKPTNEEEKEEKIVKKVEQKIAPVLRKTKEETQKIARETTQKGITKKEVEKLIKSYIKNINVDTISNMVISEVEDKMRLDQRIRGII